MQYHQYSQQNTYLAFTKLEAQQYGCCHLLGDVCYITFLE